MALCNNLCCRAGWPTAWVPDFIDASPTKCGRTLGCFRSTRACHRRSLGISVWKVESGLGFFSHHLGYPCASGARRWDMVLCSDRLEEIVALCTWWVADKSSNISRACPPKMECRRRASQAIYLGRVKCSSFFVPSAILHIPLMYDAVVGAYCYNMYAHSYLMSFFMHVGVASQSLVSWFQSLDSCIVTRGERKKGKQDHPLPLTTSSVTYPPNKLPDSPPTSDYLAT